MKVIDLLNKIENEEKVPTSIMYDGVVYIKHSHNYTYWDIGEENPLKISTLDLGDEVEIITIKEDKEIEELEFCKIDDETISGLVQSINELNHEYVDKINELVNELNKKRT